MPLSFLPEPSFCCPEGTCVREEARAACQSAHDFFSWSRLRVGSVSILETMCCREVMRRNRQQSRPQVQSWQMESCHQPTHVAKSLAWAT